MKNYLLLSSAVTLCVAFSGPTWGKTGEPSLNPGKQANIFLNQFQAQGSSKQLRRRTIDRDTRVGGGGQFAIKSFTAPTGSGPIAPPRSRSASFGVGAGRTSAKPFSGVSRTPTVSPYMNLFREDFSGNNALNYQTLVRPQLRQQQVNQQASLQTLRLNQQLTSLSARNAYNMQGSTNLAPTGHAAVFKNFSHFYPAKNRR